MMSLHLLELAQGLADIALAADPPPVPCPGSLPSCGGAGNVLATNVAPAIARMVVQFAVGISIIGVLYAGLQMIMNNGGDTSKARMAVLYSLGGLALALMSQNIYSFIATQNFGDANNAVLNILQAIASLIILVANPMFILAMVVAGTRMVIDRGKEEEFNKAKTTILWAAAGAIVINIAYALTKGVLDIFS